MSSIAAGGLAAPLEDQQAARIREAVAGLSPVQLQWVSGYIAGLAEAGAGHQAAATGTDASGVLTILYGSQTGNGQGIAEALAERARDKGYTVRLESLAGYKPTALKRETLVTFVISTHGEGDPPDDAELFHEFILAPRAPELPNLRYSVLALGDSSYVNFCQTGRELDGRLEALKAERLGTIVECDLDYESAAEAWTESIIARLPELIEARSAVPRLRAVATAVLHDKHRPFAAEVLCNQKITGANSSKDVRHIELSLEGSGIRYEPGDALAVIVENPPRLVAQFIDALGFDAGTEVRNGERATTIVEALGKDLEITVPSLGFLRAWARMSGAAELSALLEPDRQAELSRFVETHQIIDIVRRFPAPVGAGEFAAILRKLNPRSYSIASSPSANPDEVHLTVAAVRYEAHGSEHWGAASTHLADRIEPGDRLSVYVEPNARFHLPADDVPIVMIGPGTGVAPFRAFVEERAERAAPGGNWLFFGDRTLSEDFLYQLEWQRHLRDGHIERMDVAFSRDTEHKIYVQQRIRERGAELWRWIEAGAVIYVCGDAKHMAPDVHAALIDVIASGANIGRDAADARLKELRRAGRYQRDVY
jgi:sulfite reductase (NADPH) flavoprotein alpha-component